MEWTRRQFIGAGGLAAAGAFAGRPGGTVTGQVGATGVATATGDAAVAATPVADGSVRVVSTAPRRAGGWYHPNSGPLSPAAFLRLPPGAVAPRGWVAGQLELQREGLCGRLDEISDYLVYSDCGWVDPTKGAWEELPYWLRGYADLGVLTGDERIRSTTARWIDGILATQQPDGWFGPERLRTSLEGGPDFWPSMPLLDLLRNHAESTGDDRITGFLTAFYGFMAEQDNAVFGRSWGSFRWGDNIDGLYWLYNRTGEPGLLDLVHRIHQHSADYVSGFPTWHNVNIAQGFREPAQYAVLAGDSTLVAATYQRYETVMRRYGQFAGGGFAGDENCRPGFGDPRQGFETCGIVELMRSCEMLTRITGDPVWADRCEQLAVNLLPASLDPQGRSLHYITSANSVALMHLGQHPQFQNGFPMQAYRPGVHDYRCCPHNYGQGWPYYAEEMWLATPDNGLCANLYGPSEVTAEVGENRHAVTIAETTDYPFHGDVTLRVRSRGPVDFPLWLRIPNWCGAATVRINGRPAPVSADGAGYLVVDRRWREGDTVGLELPMEIGVTRWASNKDSATVTRGPVEFSLAIGESYSPYPGDDIDDPAWPHDQVLPTDDWNYGLDVDPDDIGRRITVHRSRTVADNPFTHDTAPLKVRARVRQVPNWQADEKNVVRPLQPSPVLSGDRPGSATMIPAGAARLRLTSLPLISQDGRGHQWEAPSCSHCFSGDTLDAVNDRLEPQSSYDQQMPRLTFWDHLGTTEWVQYDYATEISTGSAAVYWYDDTGHGECRLPASWRLLFRAHGVWQPVRGASGFGAEPDRWNTVTFDPVRTTAVRLELTLQDGFSGGILEWRVDQA